MWLTDTYKNPWDCKIKRCKRKKTGKNEPKSHQNINLNM